MRACSASFDLVDVPVTVVAGQLDELIPVENLRWLVESLPNASLKVFPDAGHLDFTIGESQAIIEHVLQEMERRPRPSAASDRAAELSAARIADARRRHAFLNAYTNADAVYAELQRRCELPPSASAPEAVSQAGEEEPAPRRSLWSAVYGAAKSAVASPLTVPSAVWTTLVSVGTSIDSGWTLLAT